MVRPRIYKIEAVVLRAHPLGEADRLLTLFTPDLGKLHATARGVRKTTSKLGGHLDPLTRVTLTLAKGRNLDTVTGAEALETFPAIKGDLERLSRAIYLTELVDALNPLESPSPLVYDLFLEGLRALGTDVDVDLLLRYVEFQLLSLAGYLPEIQQCVQCQGQILPQEHRFSLAAGGILCRACWPSYSDAMPLSTGALKVLRFLSTVTLPSALVLRVKAPLHRELAAIIGAWLRYTLERELRSTGFLRAVARSNSRVDAISSAGGS